MTGPRHVIFGIGAIGLATFAALRRREETVRLVNRSGHVRDPGFATAVAQGASVVYQILTRPTTNGPRSSPPCGELAAAQAAGARLVTMDHVGSVALTHRTVAVRVAR